MQSFLILTTGICYTTALIKKMNNDDSTILLLYICGTVALIGAGIFKYFERK